MIAVNGRVWRVMLGLLGVAGVSILLCAVAIIRLRVAQSSNSALIRQLQIEQAAGAAADAEQRQRESEFQRLVRGLQDQVRRLGGTPLPEPSWLQSGPSSTRTTVLVIVTPQPSAGPSPTPTQARPTTTSRPSSSPSPSSSSTCLIRIAQECAVPPSGG